LEPPPGPGNPVFDKAIDILKGAPGPAAKVTDPIPARMLNEFVYCPRLFYYEYVEGVFVQSADTVRGATLHKRVDAGSGSLAPAAQARSPLPTPGIVGSPSPEVPAESVPSSPPEQIHSRSVSLGSEKLGVVAKLDLVEGWATSAGGGQGDLFSAKVVVPVDYKVGRPREGKESNELWPADQMQLGLQILLLRDNGYTCNEGVIYYRATKQRVRFELTPEREAWVRSQIALARQTMTGPIPPPLVQSPKCRGCSLAPVCLPDETRLLARAHLTQVDAPPAVPAQEPSAESIPPRSTPRPSSVPTDRDPPRRLLIGICF